MSAPNVEKVSQLQISKNVSYYISRPPGQTSDLALSYGFKIHIEIKIRKMSNSKLVVLVLLVEVAETLQLIAFPVAAYRHFPDDFGGFFTEDI